MWSLCQQILHINTITLDECVKALFNIIFTLTSRFPKSFLLYILPSDENFASNFHDYESELRFQTKVFRLRNAIAGITPVLSVSIKCIFSEMKLLTYNSPRNLI